VSGGHEPGTATVVLVHGAWAGGWIWQRLLPLLAERGVAARTVDLPSCDGGEGPLVGLDEDERTVRAALDEVEDDIVLCGHSYGGMVVTGAADGHPRVRRLLYLCAFMPAEGESLLGMFGGAVPSFWRIRDDLRVEPKRDEAEESELDPAAQELMANGLVAQGLTAYTTPPSGIAWRTIPSTYALCTNDLSIPPDFQRQLAGRASELVELPTGHRPQLERPELVADLLARLARG
jgi:pimeloyl-ACP methyl ester carboxylesterase